MPTYKNNTAGIIPVVDINGNTAMVPTGLEIQTYRRYTITGFDLISEEPYYNPVKGITTVSKSAAGAEYLPIPVGTTHLKVWRVFGGSVSVYYQSIANTPPVAVLAAGDSFTAETDNRVGLLVIDFAAAGQCEIIAASEEIAE